MSGRAMGVSGRAMGVFGKWLRLQIDLLGVYSSVSARRNGAGHVTGKVSFYRSNWEEIGRILSVFIALKKIYRQAI